MDGFFKVTDEKQRHLAAIAELYSGSTFISELDGTKKQTFSISRRSEKI